MSDFFSGDFEHKSQELLRQYKEFNKNATEEEFTRFSQFISDMKQLAESHPQHKKINKPEYKERQLRIPQSVKAKDLLLHETSPPQKKRKFDKYSNEDREIIEPLLPSFGRVFSKFSLSVMENIISFCRGRELIQLSKCNKALYKSINRKEVWIELCRNEWNICFRIDTFIFGKHRKFWTQRTAPYENWIFEGEIFPVFESTGFDYTLEDIKESYFRHENANIFIIPSEHINTMSVNREETQKQILEEYNEISTDELREMCEERNLESMGDRDELIENLMEFEMEGVEKLDHFYKIAMDLYQRDSKKGKKQLLYLENQRKKGDFTKIRLDFIRNHKVIYILNHDDLEFYLKHATDGDLFIFRPGVHELPLQIFKGIDASISIIGDTIENDAVIIEDIEEEHHFSMELHLNKNVAARFCNLTITQRSGYEGTICVRKGHAIIEFVDIECSGSGIRICNHGSAFIFNTLIEGADVYGVCIEDDTTVAIQNVTILGCCNADFERDQAAVRIHGITDLHLKSCVIKSNGAHGIGVVKESETKESDDPLLTFFDNIIQKSKKTTSIIMENMDVGDNEACMIYECKNVTTRPCIINMDE